MNENRYHKELCEEWVKTHGLDLDNFGIVSKVIQHDKYSSTTFYFVYNKAFARPFIHESPIAEMIHTADFCFKVDGIMEAVTIEKDLHGNFAGRHSWPSVLIGELKRSQEAASLSVESIPVYSSGSGIADVNGVPFDEWQGMLERLAKSMGQL